MVTMLETKCSFLENFCDTELLSYSTWIWIVLNMYCTETSRMLKDDDCEKSLQENLLNLSFTNDRPSIPQYQLNHQLQNNPKSTSTPNHDENDGMLDTVSDRAECDPNRANYNAHHTDSGPDQAGYSLRRSCSEDFMNDDTLTDRSLSKSSSEITVSPHEEDECNKVDNKTPLSSRSLGSITSAPPKGKILYIVLSTPQKVLFTLIAKVLMVDSGCFSEVD